MQYCKIYRKFGKIMRFHGINQRCMALETYGLGVVGLLYLVVAMQDSLDDLNEPVDI